MHRKSGLLRNSLKTITNAVIADFGYLATVRANCKNHCFPAAAIRQLANNKSIDAFQPMDDAIGDQLIKGAVNLRRRAHPAIAQLV